MVRLLILRTYFVTLLTVDKRFQKPVSFCPYYMPSGKLVKFFFSGSPLLELARGFLPASRDSFNGGVTSHCRKRFLAWFFLQVPELLASGPQPDLLWVNWPR
ncbi:MAG: hypothetical protein DMG50_15190 [Acidobacteria bacterium]|nr:MAG: hypothetical protein DMG50_15190 [Acidobacteriota bacterium]